MQYFYCMLASVIDDELDRIFKAFGDPARRMIIDCLRERPKQSLFESSTHFYAEDGMTLSRQAVTQHLDMLQRAGLVRVEWSGRTKLHSLDPGPLREAVNLWLRHHL